MIKSISTRNENQIRRNFLRKGKTEVNTLVKEATILCSKVTATDCFFYRSLMNPRGQSKKEKTATKKPVKRKSQKQIKKERKYT